MYRGIEFTISNNLSFLIQLLSLDIFSNSKTHVSQSEMIAHGDNFDFQNGISSQEMIKVIKENVPLVIFLNLRLLECDGSPKCIHSYSDFIDSDYLMLCLITDVHTVEIYTKNDEVLSDIKTIATLTGAETLSFKTDLDCRCELNIC